MTSDKNGNAYSAVAAGGGAVDIMKKGTSGNWDSFASAEYNGGNSQLPEGLAIDKSGNLYLMSTIASTSKYDDSLTTNPMPLNTEARYTIVQSGSAQGWAQAVPNSTLTGNGDVAAFNSGAMIVWVDYKDGYIHYKLLTP